MTVEDEHDAEPLVCADCGKPIAPGEARWYRAFSASNPDARLGRNLADRISATDNGGVPFHRECLTRLLPGFELGDNNT